MRPSVWKEKLKPEKLRGPGPQGWSPPGRQPSLCCTYTCLGDPLPKRSGPTAVTGAGPQFAENISEWTSFKET